ncbi:hypothetical protein AALC17_12580 [Oscillospiraceae bacterium 38-13]
MESEGNKDSGNDLPAEQKGIFSSSELSVNSENLEEIKPELSEENKLRIASAFAQTDATQKHDQLSEQMAGQDAVSGTVIPAGGFGSNSNSTASTATGDIRIPGVKKKSKWPLVLAALVILAAVSGVVAWLVIGKPPTNGQKTPSQLFEDYKNYLVVGPEQSSTAAEENTTPSQVWFLFRLPESELTVDEQEAYIAELKNKYAEFKNACSGQICEQLNSYGQILTLALTAPSIDIYVSQLTQEYIQNGSEVAYTYIQSVTNFDSQSTLAISIFSALDRLLSTGLSLLEVYQTEGCIVDGVMDSACETALNDNQAHYDILRQQDAALRMLESSARAVTITFQQNTENIQKALKEENE